jgi:hypothetical protein
MITEESLQLVNSAARLPSSADARLLRRWQARDRRIAAIHEGGHTIVAWLEGLEAEPRIWPREADNRQEMFWGGECLYGPGFVSDMARRRIAVAGVVAESTWIDMHPQYGLRDAPAPLTHMSAADWETARQPYGKADWRMRRAEAQVRARFRRPDVWEDVLTVAHHVIYFAPESPYEGEVDAAREEFEAQIAAVVAEIRAATHSAT